MPRAGVLDVAQVRFQRPAVDPCLAPAAQQPAWSDAAQVQRVREELAARGPLVRSEDVWRLRLALARVAAGEAHVMQGGDCAEDPAESGEGYVARKCALLHVLAGAMESVTRKPVIRVGRIAGQFAKPRSRDTEWVAGLELPPYRGHMVNRPEPTVEHRRPDPANILAGYAAARRVMRHLGWLGGVGQPASGAEVWTSHEALLMDYEIPMLRRDETGAVLLTSTHWPWVGERSRQLDGAHVALLAAVANPVAAKIGPRAEPDQVLALCEQLAPGRVAGRLTLIARMGARKVADRLPALVAAVRAAGHPVIWLTDPMHANTVITRDGLKTRCLDAVVREVEDFHRAVLSAGGVAGGLHLEATPDDVTECAASEGAVDEVARRYTTLCDPRLNPKQALLVASAWRRC